MAQFAWCAALCLLSTTPAMADMSACQSAVGTSVNERISDLTTCILKGRNGASANGFLYTLRGASYAELGQTDKAIIDYTTAIGLNPDFSITFALRGAIFANRGDFSSAQADFDSAIAHATGGENVAASLSMKAWLLATWVDPAMRDGPRAVALTLKAIKRRDLANFHDVLAAAYAETGQFDKAIGEESAAISRVRGKDREIELPGYKERLALYLANMPYHTKLPFPLPPHVDL